MMYAVVLLGQLFSSMEQIHVLVKLFYICIASNLEICALNNFIELHTCSSSVNLDNNASHSACTIHKNLIFLLGIYFLHFIRSLMATVEKMLPTLFVIIYQG